MSRRKIKIRPKKGKGTLRPVVTREGQLQALQLSGILKHVLPEPLASLVRLLRNYAEGCGLYAYLDPDAARVNRGGIGVVQGIKEFYIAPPRLEGDLVVPANAVLVEFRPQGNEIAVPSGTPMGIWCKHEGSTGVEADLLVPTLETRIHHPGGAVSRIDQDGDRLRIVEDES